MASRNFGLTDVRKPHLIRGSGGVQAEVGTLRDDVEAAIVGLEEETNAPVVANARIRVNTQPVATNTVTIGTEVFEFVAAAGDIAQPTNIPVILTGVSVAADLLALVSAINNQGTNNVLASVVNTDYLQVEAADSPGGSPVPYTAPTTVLDATLAGTPAWSSETLGSASGSVSLKRALLRLVVDATNVAGAFDVELPFTPVGARLVAHTDAGGDLVAPATTATYTPVPARSVVTVDFTAGATAPTATDIVWVEVTGV